MAESNRVYFAKSLRCAQKLAFEPSNSLGKIRRLDNADFSDMCLPLVGLNNEVALVAHFGPPAGIEILIWRLNVYELLYLA